MPPISNSPSINGRFIIVGGGLAGHRAAIQLRRLSKQARITLISLEPGLPYDRPPLTKQLLLGSMAETDLVLNGARNYAELSIDHHPSTTVVDIDPARHEVFARDSSGHGRTFTYDRLLLATGSEPRPLVSLEASDNVHYIRRLADSVRLKAALLPGRHIAIVGGGFIGLEVAAAARGLGCEVTVIEASDRLLSRTTPPFVGRFFRDQHTDRGVEILLNQAVLKVEKDGRKVVLQLHDRSLKADTVVVGVGVVPNTELAERAGLAVCDGIVVDRQCRTSDPYIFAAGEVTAHPSDRNGTLRRIESWRIANEQPAVAAAAMLGQNSVAFDDPPWFWSDQFGFNVQVIGSLEPDARYLFLGDISAPKWTLIRIDENGLPLGAAAVNDGRNISLLRRLIREGLPLPPALSDNCIVADRVFERQHELGIAGYHDVTRFEKLTG